MVGVTTDYTMPGEVLLVDTTAGSYCYSSDDPAIGDRVQFVDAAGSSVLTIVVSVSNTNTYKIANLNETLNSTRPKPTIEPVVGSTYGWVLLDT